MGGAKQDGNQTDENETQGLFVGKQRTRVIAPLYLYVLLYHVCECLIVHLFFYLYPVCDCRVPVSYLAVSHLS
jgi:hypothetical protein